MTLETTLTSLRGFNCFSPFSTKVENWRKVLNFLFHWNIEKQATDYKYTVAPKRLQKIYVIVERKYNGLKDWECNSVNATFCPFHTSNLYSLVLTSSIAYTVDDDKYLGINISKADLKYDKQIDACACQNKSQFTFLVNQPSLKLKKPHLR